MKSLFSALVTITLLTSCVSAPVSVQEAGALRVAASFYPLAFLAEQIGGEHVTVTQITPHGTEPHDYEPTPGDLRTMEQAKLFLYNGSGFDPWAQRVATELQERGVRTFVLTDDVELRYSFEIDHDEEFEEEGIVHDERDEDRPMTVDPHVWLDFKSMAKRVPEIVRVFGSLNPDHAAAYAKNGAALIARFEALDRAYESALATCQRHEIFVAHDAYAYLAGRYAIVVRALAGLSPEDEPSPARMAEIAREAKLAEVRVIFFEALVDPKLAQTIADEIGAKIEVLHPAEGLTLAQLAAGDDYFSLMQQNLTVLTDALACPKS